MLALRVKKSDPHEGHDHGPSKNKGKRTKGLWTVKIEPQQEAGDDMYYVWLWEGSQVMRKVYAALALAAIFAIVCYPLWPVKLRQGGYYLSWAFLCFMGLFFAMAIFRVILFCITYFVLSPGFWLFPNLWEDVSVVDSFKPLYGWHEVSFPLCLPLQYILTSHLPARWRQEREKEGQEDVRLGERGQHILCYHRTACPRDSHHDCYCYPDRYGPPAAQLRVAEGGGTGG
jgi:hypothetical protein